MAPNFRTIDEILFQARTLKSRPDCLVWKEGGQWREMSTDAVETAVLEIGAGLRRLGVRPGDRVGILVPSSVHWLLFDLGALYAGAVTVPLFDNLTEDHLRLEAEDAGLIAVFVADAVQQALVGRTCPRGIQVVTLQPGRTEGATSLAELRRGHSAEDLDAIWKTAMSLDEDHLATIIYTSGSTGVPKGVELTHGALATQVRAIFERFPLDPKTDVSLTCLPLAHVFERAVVLYHLAAGVRLVFAESIQTVGDALREQQPTVFTVVPRLLEKVLEKIEVGAREGGGLRRTIVGLALREADREPSWIRTPWRALCGVLVYRHVRALLGGRLRLVVAGGAALGRRTERVFRAFEIPVYQGYGLTEHAPVVAANYPGHVRAGSVGPAFPGVRIRIAEDGEVLVHSRQIMRGYRNRPDETAEVKDAEGWLHTGDLGHLDADGFLFLTGRKKDMCKTAAGKYVVPGPIEERLASHKGIEHAVVCADGRKFVSALVTPDMAAIRRRIREVGFRGTEQEFLEGPLLSSVFRHVDRINKTLDNWSRIRRLSIVKPFTIEGGELTPTLKVRRDKVLARHAALLDSFYEGDAT